MNQRKNNNSIIFLTTLGVYLGLVLVGGAAPQVFAHSATTRIFEITDEIELSDDLDNKPNGCESLEARVREKRASLLFDNDSLLKYVSGLGNVISSAPKLGPESFKFAWASYGEKSPLNYVGGSAVDPAKPVLVNGLRRRELDDRVRGLSNIFPAVNDDGKSSFEFVVSIDAASFASYAKLARQDQNDAHRAYIAYDASLDYWRCANSDPLTKALLDNTSITWSNNQVFIVTRLPRAALISLFAKDAK